MNYLQCLYREGDKVTCGSGVEVTFESLSPCHFNSGVEVVWKWCGSRFLSGEKGFTALNYSHSIVPGGLLVISKTTLLTPSTSLTIRLEIISKTS